MSNLNIIAIAGRITQTPELKVLTSGHSLLSINIANNKSIKKNDEWKTKVCFIECNVWGKYADSLNEKLEKGFLINVSGALDFQQREDQNGNKRSKHLINVSSLEILSKPGPTPSNGNQSPPQNDSDGNPFDDSDIPF